MKIKIISLCCIDSSFASDIAQNLGIDLTPINSITFKQGEVKSFPEDTVRESTVFVLWQPHTEENINSQIMRVCILSNALQRASADKIILVAPFLPYMRQDYRSKHREPITAELIPRLLKESGIGHVVTYDLHAKQSEGFFEKVDNPGFTTILKKHFDAKKYDTSNLVVSTADVGGGERVKKLAKKLEVPFVVIDKTRGQKKEVEEMMLLGEVNGKNVLLFDDMTDTGNTLIKAANLLKQKGAKKIMCGITHMFNDDTLIKNLDESIIDHVFTTDSMHRNTLPYKFEIISLANKTAEIIKNISEGNSVDLA